MKTRKTLTAALLCALIVAAAGCGGNNASTTTTAAETTTTTTAAETTTTAAETTTTTTPAETTTEEEEDPMAFTAPLFTRGIWEAYSDGELSSYFAFYDETSGAIVDTEDKMATEFTCEQNGTEITFYLGDSKMEVKSDFSLGDSEGTFHFETGDKVYTFSATDMTAEPEAFVVEFLASAATSAAPLFSRGVWTASLNGEINSYFVFYDEANGTIINPDMQTGLPFACEQNGTDILFHIAAADDNTTATFSTGDNTGTFTYADGSVETYVFEAFSDDPDAFMALVG